MTGNDAAESAAAELRKGPFSFAACAGHLRRRIERADVLHEPRRGADEWADEVVSALNLSSGKRLQEFLRGAGSERLGLELTYGYGLTLAANAELALRRSLHAVAAEALAALAAKKEQGLAAGAPIGAYPPGARWTLEALEERCAESVWAQTARALGAVQAKETHAQAERAAEKEGRAFAEETLRSAQLDWDGLLDVFDSARELWLEGADDEEGSLAGKMREPVLERMAERATDEIWMLAGEVAAPEAAESPGAGK